MQFPAHEIGVERFLLEDLSVVLHIKFAVGRGDRRRAAADMMGDGLFQELSAHEADELGKEFSAGRAVHHHELHDAVVGLRRGTERDAAAQLLAVAHRGDHRVVLARFAVDGDKEPAPLIAEERREQAAEVFAAPAAAAHVLAAAQDLHIHPRARDIQGAAGAAFDVVDGLRLAVKDAGDGFCAERDPDRRGKIVARARGDDPYRRRPPRRAASAPPR